jgi:predicted flap endonuclease-1-like 5' DNA nuclease
MPFNNSDRKALLAIKGVGPTVVKRLEEQGFQSLAQLSNASTSEIVAVAAASVGSTCWKNSPQARAAIDAAIACAKSLTEGAARDERPARKAASRR